eukprot:12023089-Karenia_brevis.AAC.1
MLQCYDFSRALPRATSLGEAINTYHNFPNYQALAARHGVVAFEFSQAPNELEPPVTFTALQQLAVDRAIAGIDRALAIMNASDGLERDALLDECWSDNYIQVVDGPPGTGKTFVQHYLLRYTLRQG